MDTENVYSDHFFQKHNIIVNALDNIETRRYIDGYSYIFFLNKKLSKWARTRNFLLTLRVLF